MVIRPHTIFFILMFFDLTVFGQSQKKIRYIQFEKPVSQIKICDTCSLDEITNSIRNRIKFYSIDTNVVYILEKADTLIEIVEFTENGGVDYSYYFNNLLKIKFYQNSIDTHDYSLRVMNDVEIELKQWLVKPKEIHVTDYEESNGNIMKKYFAQIFKGKNVKIEFTKEWNLGSFKSGISIIYKKNKLGGWSIKKKESVGEFEWPSSN